MLIEFSAGIVRIFFDKSFLIAFYSPYGDMKADDPCEEMKTDTLLGHVHYTRDSCNILEGTIIDEYIVYDKKYNKYLDDEKKLILTLGGSTTDGFYQSEPAFGYSWPLYLSRLVENNQIVINGGVGGYGSLQEFYKLARDIERFKNLELVVSLNGINELGYYFEQENQAFEHPFLLPKQNLMNINQVWIDQRLSNSFLRKIIPNIMSLVTALSDVNAKNKVSEQKDSNSLLFKPISIPDRWEINVKRMHSLASQMDVKYLVFLQPTMGLEGEQSVAPKNSNDRKLLNEIGADYLLHINNLYSSLKEKCSKLEFCYDISDKVPPSGDFYNDPRHHNKYGNKLLAQEIFKFIKNY